MNETADFDVAVVGGGISGLYAAWRLLGSGRPEYRRVCVLESAARLGGRISSMQPPGPGARFDLGAMRFVSDHDMVRRLTEELGVPTRRIEPGDPSRALFYLRGARVRASDIAAPGDGLPYRLTPSERSMHPDDLFHAVIARALAESGRDIPVDRRGWNELKQNGTFRGCPLHDLGFWNVAAELLSSEAYALLRDANGYDCNNWSAAEVMQTQLASFGKDTSYWRFSAGADSFTDALAARVVALGGTTLAGQQVRELSADETGRLRLVASAGQARRVIAAGHVVAALPPRAVELIDSHGLLADSRADLESVVSQPSLKILLGFDRAWWELEPLGITGGRSNTDLPIRQVYYLDDRPVPGHRDAIPTLVILCNDDRAYDFFQPVPPLAQAALGDDDTVADPAVARILRHALAQLAELHGVAVPRPRWIVIRDWAHDPFGGAYHGWKPGRRGWEVARRLRQPVSGVGLHVCGSAYSDLPTWMEGALGNTEQMLQSTLGLAPPAWLPQPTYLGW